MNAEATRRDALRRGAIGAGAIAAAGVLPALARPAAALAQTEDEENLKDFLEPAIELEQASVLAYATALDAQGLDAETAKMLELFRDQEQAHANALRSALDSLGFELPDAPETPDDSEDLDDLEGLDKADEYLQFLVELERQLIALYQDSAPALESEDLSRTAAELVGSHAQHIVALRLALGDDAAEALAQVAGTRTGEGEPPA